MNLKVSEEIWIYKIFGSTIAFVNSGAVNLIPIPRFAPDISLCII
jgi:hypothetical protein